jgi:hypothetical protein
VQSSTPLLLSHFLKKFYKTNKKWGKNRILYYILPQNKNSKESKDSNQQLRYEGSLISKFFQNKNSKESKDSNQQLR